MIRKLLYIYKDNGSFSHYQPFYYTFNDMGSAVMITNRLGLPVQYYLYDPWGSVTNTKTDPVNNFAFVGRYGGWKDWDTGLINFWHRWYDSDDGRWISKDPIGIEFIPVFAQQPGKLNRSRGASMRAWSGY